MNTIVTKDFCYGCGACKQICPKQCIHMIYDKEGFLYPQINEKKCIECNRCGDVCPVLNSPKANREISEAYAITNLNRDTLQNSASGGFFSLLSEYVLKSGGVVYGASFDKNFLVRHVVVRTIEDLIKLQKSKYVQSEIGNSYNEIYDFLKNGKTVLFTGTPCQIAGLYTFLGKKNSNLITMEVICHGVPSPGVWKKYLSEIETIRNKKVTHYDFRFKPLKKDKEDIVNGIATYGWKSPQVKIDYEDNTSTQVFMEGDIYTGGFAQNLLLRKCCSNCQYKINDKFSGSDFIAGDYFGIEKEHPGFPYLDGVSAILLNTYKAKKIFEELKEKMNWVVSSYYKIRTTNYPLYKKAVLHKNRDSFFDSFKEKSEDSNYSVIQEIKKNLGFDFGVDRCLTFGVWGSYNLRQSIWNMISGSPNKLIFQFSNSSLISAFSESNELSIHKFPKNAFRESMLRADFNKTFVKTILNCQKNMPDFLLIDLLEERFKVYANDSLYYTKSDAFDDSEIVQDANVKLLNNHECFELWKKACDALIDTLNKNNNSFVVIENYLAETYGEKKVPFININEINGINKQLEKYYNYLRTKIGDDAIISIPRSFFNCDEHHKHGVFPWHYNISTYDYIAKQVYEKIKRML